MSASEDKPQGDIRRQTTLDEMLGHDALRTYLRAALRDGSLPQALLLCGPPGVGKRTMAWALAREIAAGGADARTHRGSLKVSRGTHPDVMAVESNSASGQIRVDDIRDLIEWTARYPIEAGHKIAIISPAERMNESSANAILKLLEEPPHHLRLMLVTPDPARMLTTIRSRCTPVILEAVEEESLVPWLSARAAVGTERAALAARIAEGRPGHALALLAAGGLESRAEILRELTLLCEHGFTSVFGVADRLAGALGDTAEMFRMTALLLRDVLWIALGRQGILNEDLRMELATLGGRLSPEGVFEAAQLAESAAGEAADFYTPAARQHYLETLVMKIGQAMKKGG